MNTVTKIVITFLFVLCSFPAYSSPFMGNDLGKPTLDMQNRILANILGKPISVLDLVKKMDMIFFREYPQYSSSPEARFQFYQTSWKPMLREMVDKELLLADAKELKIEITSGELRQELESIFGPNLIENLDKAKLTFDEAMSLINEEMLIRRILYYRVNLKAIRTVTPQMIHAAYKDYSKQNIRLDEWIFHVITFRCPDEIISARLADAAYQLLADDHVPLSKIDQSLKNHPTYDASATLSISEKFNNSDKEIAENYKEILSKLDNGSYSRPVSQKSRSGSTVFRIFYLDKKIPGGEIPFTEVETTLKYRLLEEEVTKGKKSYLEKLYKHFDTYPDKIISQLPSDYEPFSLH